MTVIGMVLLSFLITCVPVFTGLSITRTAYWNCGKPYITQEKEYIYMNDSGIEFGCHDDEDEFIRSMIIIQVAFPNITEIVINEKCKEFLIRGELECIPYDDILAGRVQGGKPFKRWNHSFLFYFEDEDVFREELRKRCVNAYWEDENGEELTKW